MTLTTLPTAPSRADPANFSARADAMMAALPVMVTEINAALALIEEARTTATALTNAVSNAAGSAAAAAASAAQAALVSGGSAGAYPAMRPALLINFAAAGMMDPRLSFARASSGTRINAAGQMESVGVNMPRIDHDPVTRECLGLLIEGAATNLCVRSEDFTSALWGVTNGTKTTGVADPWGGTTAATFTAGSTGSCNIQCGSATVTVGETYTVSCWIRRRTGTGPVGIRAVENVNGPALPVTTEWRRYSLTATATQTIGRAGVNLSVEGDAVDVWGFQLELGTGPTSYIKTPASVSVSRSADICTLDNAAMAAWLRATEGTLVVDALAPAGVMSTAHVAAELYADADNRIAVGTDPTRIARGLVVQGGGAQAALMAAGTWPSRGRAALAWRNDDVAFSVAAGAALIDSSAEVPTPTSLAIGRKGSSDGGWWNGVIASVAYYPVRLSAVELQALSTL